MAFLSRQNKAPPQPQQENQIYSYGRGKHDQIDQNKIQAKAAIQEDYKKYLEYQMKIANDRKLEEKRKNQEEDIRVRREIQEINRKENQRILKEKEKQTKVVNTAQNSESNPHIRSKPSATNLNQHSNSSSNQSQNPYQSQFQPQKIPHLPIDQSPSPPSYKLYQQQQYSEQSRARPYIFQENEQANTYYEERIRRHKEQMNQKLEELSFHIRSTKDHLQVDEEIDKIRRRLRAKPNSQLTENPQIQGQSRVQLEYQNQFFNIPKKNSEVYRGSSSNSRGKSRALEYQSKSKFVQSRNIDQQYKLKTQDNLYNLPERRQYEEDNRWGTKPGKDNYLSNRQALDYQAESILGKIDGFLSKLNNS